MMCYKPKEQFPSYHILQENSAALRFFTNSLKEIRSKSNPDPYEIYYLLRWTWKTIGFNDDSIDKIFQKPERRIMKDEGKTEIESLIESTIAHIKTALDNSKPGEAKVYTEMLVLLRETLSHSLETQKRMELFDKTYSKPFEKISEKHILDAPLKRG